MKTEPFLPVAALVVGFVVAISNNLVNNVPLGLVAGGTLQAAHVQGIMPHSLPTMKDPAALPW